MIKRLIDCWRILTGHYKNYFIVSASDKELAKVTEPNTEWNIDIRYNGVKPDQLYFIMMGIISGFHEEMNKENK